jgi:argininosuccinate lyase
MMHISRLAEEFVWWNSQEFSYIAVDDGFCTGSSIMPQKKNPDMAELLRGKSGRVYGNLMRLLTVMKGTPMAYNKDFQEDKEALFDTIDTWRDSLLIFAKMLEKTEFRLDIIARHTSSGFLAATDIAEKLAKGGLPFREAHELVGRMVKYCEKRDKTFEDLGAEDLAAIDGRLSPEILGDLSLMACVRARASFGGTAPLEVRRQIAAGREWLDVMKSHGIC